MGRECSEWVTNGSGSGRPHVIMARIGSGTGASAHLSPCAYHLCDTPPWHRPCPSASTHFTYSQQLTPGSLAPREEANLDIARGEVLQRNQSMDFQTLEGTVHLSKPFRSRKTKKVRTMITFTPRKSHFDTTNEHSGTNEFRVRTPSMPH